MKGPIDINFKGNDTINDINKDFKVDKIINLEPGEQLSKIIISNLLKISKDIQEEEEIKLSKEYQVLSKNTSLFGEILKDGINKENELIKVELNQNEKNDFTYLNQNLNYAPLNSLSFGYGSSFVPMMSKKKRYNADRGIALGGANFFNNNFMVGAAPMMMMNNFAGAGGFVNNNSNNMSNFHQDEMMNMMMEPPQLNSKKFSAKIEKNEEKIDLNKLLMSQDIIEGFWDENDNSLLIKKKINQKFVKIEDFVNAEKGIKDKKKVIFTILVIYYLLNDMKDKLDELRLIINKGKKYLNSIGYNYDLIIQKIGI